MTIRKSALSLFLSALIVACNEGSISSPSIVASTAAASHGASPAGSNSGKGVTGSAMGNGAPGFMPGAKGYANNGNSSNAFLVWCHQQAASASADIGPSGGMVEIGGVRLILPAGALTKTTHITATMREGDYPIVDFEPSGLQFKKPAGLQWNVAGCDISPDYVPDIVYLNDEGVIVERISATYSSYWKTVAAPVDHFSAYALAY